MSEKRERKEGLRMGGGIGRGRMDGGRMETEG